MTGGKDIVAETVALLSVHPRYARRILEGSKRVEFRKRPFGRDVDWVVVYATKPVGEVVGFFRVKAVVEASPYDLWPRFCGVGGIAAHEFWRYYRGAETGCAIQVGEVSPLPRPVALADLGDLRAPQSYRYLPPALFADLRRRASA